MKFDEFRDDLVKRSIESYNIPVREYNEKWESIPQYVPFSLRWIVALYMCLTKKSFKMSDYREVFEFKVK